MKYRNNKETKKKTSETKIWFFKKIKKIDKSLASQTEKTEKAQITKIRNLGENITTNFTEINRIIREHY